MSRIKILSDNLINKIAAGEVLERPVSALKELLENSIDAKAKKIDIFIRNGGKSEITVSDDGTGIEKEDLKRSVLRHATSKLNSEKLNQIKTMGFRGEALSSIVSVSDFIMRSNIFNSTDGYEISLSSGNLKHVKPVNQKKGTYVSVKNIFFSTPARLKFLKSENYESLLIKRLLKKFALINVNTQFNLFVDKKVVIKTTLFKEKNSKNDFFHRVAEILGKEFVENSVELNAECNGIYLNGLLGFPTFNYANTNNQFIFVNGRIINDKSLNTILKIAYKDLMFHDRFPQLILHIQCPFEWVDVNVHPMKNEVRFYDSKFLNSFIIKSIKTSLEKIGHKTSTLNSSKIIEKFSQENHIQQNLTLKEPSSKIYKTKDENINLNESSKDASDSYTLGFAKSQFHENYIISQTETGIIIIDQHAAHERIIYEKIKEDFYNNDVKTQILLIPVVVNVDSMILKSVEKKLIYLQKYGLKIENFGPNSLIIREIPVIIINCDVKKLVESIINDLFNEKDSNTLEVQINKICSTIACHGSIRSGRELQIDEMNELLRKMEKTKFSGQCNHGRPTYVELNLSQIEKLFGRK